MVLPVGNITVTAGLEVISEAQLPTRTYRLDMETGNIAGVVDGLEAIKQAIYKALSTIRFAHIIYTDDYGFENLIGKDKIFARAELPRRIKEAVLQDERIRSIDQFKIEFDKDEAHVSFICETRYGDIQVEWMVDENV